MDAEGGTHLSIPEVKASNIDEEGVNETERPRSQGDSDSSSVKSGEPLLSHIVLDLDDRSGDKIQYNNIELIPEIQVFEPDSEEPVPAVIAEEKELDSDKTGDQCDECHLDLDSNTQYLEIPVVFRNYGIKDSDGIKDTYLQPFKVDEAEEGDLYFQHISLCTENHQSEDAEEYKEQCDKLLKFDQEFGLPSTSGPVTEHTRVDHTYTDQELSNRKFSTIGPTGTFVRDTHKKHRHHHRKHPHPHNKVQKLISEEQFRASKETDLSTLHHTVPIDEQISPVAEEVDEKKLKHTSLIEGNLVHLDIEDALSRSPGETYKLDRHRKSEPILSKVRRARPSSFKDEDKVKDVATEETPGELKPPKPPRKHHHRHRHHHRRKLNRRESLESKIMSGLEELEEESKVIRAIATGINEEIKGDYDPNEVDDITNHRMGNIQNIRHISSVRPSRRAMYNRADSIISASKTSLRGTSFRGDTCVDLQADTECSVDHEKPAIPEGFVELEELTEIEKNQFQWKQRARWIKFEEEVEKNERWGKPHVASLSFHSLLELRKGIEQGSVLLNLDNFDLPTIFESVVDNMVITDQVNSSQRNRVLDLLLLRHCHHYQRFGSIRGRRPSIASMTSLLKGDHPDGDQGGEMEMKLMMDGNNVRDSLVLDNVFVDGERIGTRDEHISDEGLYRNGHHTGPAIKFAPITTEPKAPDTVAVTESDVKSRIPAGAEATSVLVGTLEELERQTVAFVRLSKGCFLGNLTEVSIPVRFLFIVLGPPSTHNYYEIGRSLATLMSDKIFHDLAYEAKGKDDILSAMNSFLDDSIVLSPGDWDQHLLLPLLKAEITAKKKERRKLLKEKAHEDVPTDLQPFLRTGRMFGGLVRDIKRKSKFYLSDFVDGLDARCLVSLIFIFFATLAPTLSFGGLLRKKTDGAFGVLETLFATSVCGMLFSLTAGQPLIIVGVTGPILVFEEIVHKVSITYLPYDNYLQWRLWIGLWVMLILWLIVATERCYLVQHFTRFTEEVFSVMISLLFVYDAVSFVFQTFKKYPIQHGEYVITQNVTISHGMYNNKSYDNMSCVHSDSQDGQTEYLSCNVTCDGTNVGLISSLLVVGTFFISFYLRKLRFSQFFSSKARRVLSDFGVPIAMISMVSINVIMDVQVPKITMPHSFTPTMSSRKHFLIYDFWKISILWVFIGIIPAICVSILLFMETELTGVLLNKNSNKLKKGGGYNLDLMAVGLCTGITSVFGLPWMCPGPIRSVQHQKALMIMSRTHAPGEKPYLEQIKEQRVTNFGIHLLMGVTLTAFSLFEMTPLAVCYGVFLYLGISSLSGIQFIEQLKLIFVPMKYHPNKKYVQHVRLRNLLSYTGIQVVCLAILLILKLTAAAPAFPFFLIAMVFIRKSFVKFYPPEELEDLDNSEDEEEEDGDDEYNTGFL